MNSLKNLVIFQWAKKQKLSFKTCNMICTKKSYCQGLKKFLGNVGGFGFNYKVLNTPKAEWLSYVTRPMQK